MGYFLKRSNNGGIFGKWLLFVQPPVDKIDLPEFQSLFPTFKEMAQSFSLESYSSVGGAYTVIEPQIKVDRKLRRRIEQIREMASPTSI